jgi:hypothetical protein
MSIPFDCSEFILGLRRKAALMRIKGFSDPGPGMSVIPSHARFESLQRMPLAKMKNESGTSRVLGESAPRQ